MNVNEHSTKNRPNLRLLSNEAIERIHQSSIRLLVDVGVTIESREALNILREGGADIDEVKRNAKIPPSLVEEALRKTPHRLTVYSRDKRHDLNLAENNVYFDPGSAAISLLDYSQASPRPPTLSDVKDFAVVVDSLKNIHAQSTALVPMDMPETLRDRIRLYVVLKYSTKPVVTGAFTVDGISDMKRMLDIVSDSSSTKIRPIAIFDVCPSPPLKWSYLAAKNLIDCAEAGLPVELVSMPQVSATAPATLAGCLVQHNAEVLSGIVIAQLAGPGTPVIYGGSPALFDPRYGTSVTGSPEVLLLSCGYVDIAKHYGLPSHAYLGMSDAKVIDYQASFETTLGALIGILKGVNIVSGAGMIEFESCQSLEKLVLDDEICGYVYRIATGIDVTEETLANQIFQESVAKGHFLSQKHTIRWLRREHYMPSELVDRRDRSMWRALGGLDALKRARTQVEQILSDHQPEPLQPDIEKELTRFAVSICRSHGAPRLTL